MPSRESFETIKNKVFMACQWVGTITGITLASSTLTGCTLSYPKSTVVVASADRALSVNDTFVPITKTSAAALTLPTPTTAQNGSLLEVASTTNFAHVITGAGLVFDGTTGVAKGTLTFAAFAGASITLIAYNAKWYVLANVGVTIT